MEQIYKTPVISVILPVFNVEGYLEQCLDSILAQTFVDFEIICVNDGSTDNSRAILEAYSKKDKRIIIVDKENGGLSSARNVGLSYVRGDYISFIDSDDWVDMKFLELLYKNITKFNTDISMCAVKLFDDTTKIIIDDDAYFNFSVFPKELDSKVFSFKDTKAFTMDVPVMAWNKLYRRKFLESCNASFPNGKIFEDGPFFFSIYFKTKNVSMIRNQLYVYRINREGSIIKQVGIKFFDIIDVVNLMFEQLKQSSIFEDVKYDFFKHKANDIIYRYELISLKLKQRFSKKFKSESCLLDERYFDLAKINKTEPIIYKQICIIKAKTSVLAFYRHKFEVRLMYKIMQVLYTEKDIYYFKFWDLKFRFKKRPYLCDIWYEDDKIYCILLNILKFQFKFEYSKLSKK